MPVEEKAFCVVFNLHLFYLGFKYRGNCSFRMGHQPIFAIDTAITFGSNGAVGTSWLSSDLQSKKRVRISRRPTERGD
jgi:hypothetical protein